MYFRLYLFIFEGLNSGKKFSQEQIESLPSKVYEEWLKRKSWEKEENWIINKTIRRNIFCELFY